MAEVPDIEINFIPPLRAKCNYVGAPAIFILELECQHICDAFDSYGCFLVGSATAQGCRLIFNFRRKRTQTICTKAGATLSECLQCGARYEQPDL